HEGRVAIEGFYDQVKPLEDWERDAWRKLPVDGDKLILEETGAPELFGETGYNSMERIWARPTAEINGIGGGYQGKGTKTVIASHAIAKLTVGLVPEQEGDEILKLAKEHLRQNLPKGVTMEITTGHSGPWYLTDPHSKLGEAAQRALRKAFDRDVALIREGGSIPIVSQCREILGIETLLMGLALPDCRAHAPNENFPLENFDGGIRLNKAILQELAPAYHGHLVCGAGGHPACRSPRTVAAQSARTIGLESPLRTADTTTSRYEMGSDTCDLVRSCRCRACSRRIIRQKDQKDSRADANPESGP